MLRMYVHCHYLGQSPIPFNFKLVHTGFRRAEACTFPLTFMGLSRSTAYSIQEVLNMVLQPDTLCQKS